MPGRPLSESMMVYANDKALAKKHGEWARRIVEKRFSREAMVKGHERLYLSLIDELKSVEVKAAGISDG